MFAPREELARFQVFDLFGVKSAFCVGENAREICVIDAEYGDVEECRQYFAACSACH